MNFIALDAYPLYEVETDIYPYVIRNRKTKHIMHMLDRGNGYLCTRLSGKLIYVHRLIAEQFIPNPDNLPCVDHINGDKTDYRLSNLRWVSHKDNTLNCHSYGKKSFEVVPYDDYEFKDGLVSVESYNHHKFEDLYYHPGLIKFYIDIGFGFREVHTQIDKKYNYAYIVVNDINNKHAHIAFTKFQKQLEQSED